MERLSRRDFLRTAAAVSLGAAAGAGCTRVATPPWAEEGFDAGPVRHLLPTASHDHVLVKASLASAPGAPPRLSIGGDLVPGRSVGGTGRFFTFDRSGLAPGTTHELRLLDAGGTPLCDPWTLRTLPHPDAAAERLRVLFLSCAGGPELAHPLTGAPIFQPLGVRRRLLARALAFEPDVVVVNGDHVYWDLRTGGFAWITGGPVGWLRTGLFDREAPVLGDPNEDVLHRAFGPQIGDLYGTMLRSVPTFFVRDDHDYGDNDEPAVFPTDAFMRALADATQALYYPEHLPDPTMPARVSDARSLARVAGRLRFGRLFEALLYDCRGELSRGPDPDEARFVAPDVEAWLVRRTRSSDAAHLVHVPSTPILWSAGKWGEWYPDVLGEDGTLATSAPKPDWPRGWQRQHDRLLAASVGRSDRIPLWVSGDLHATAMGEIVESGGTRLAQPAVSVLCGTPGTAGPGWPSRFRGTPPRPSTTLVANEWVPPVEENGFTLLEAEPDRIVVSQFRWRAEQGLDAIARLEPFAVRDLARRSA